MRVLIKGNSGFEIIPGMHVAASYDCNGKVFVETLLDGQLWWDRVTKRYSEKHKMKIIKCCYCDKPAIQLDHYWPYEKANCLCKDHQDRAI